MAGGPEASLGFEADDLIARILTEIEEVISIIERPFQRSVPPAPSGAADETQAALGRPDPT